MANKEENKVQREKQEEPPKISEETFLKWTTKLPRLKHRLSLLLKSFNAPESVLVEELAPETYEETKQEIERLCAPSEVGGSEEAKDSKMLSYEAAKEVEAHIL